MRARARSTTHFLAMLSGALKRCVASFRSFGKRSYVAAWSAGLICDVGGMVSSSLFLIPWRPRAKMAAKA